MKSIKTILLLSCLIFASSLWAVSVSGPTGTIQINSGASYASSSDVVLTIKADDPANIAGMQIANNTSYHDTEPYAETKNWTLTAGDGLKTLRVRFIDLLGNTTTPGISASITLDTTAPMLNLIGSSTIEIWQNDIYTDLGATANDNIDGDISDRIVTSGLPLDSSLLGTSTIIYDVGDNAGNRASSTSRMVIVLATSTATSTEPIITPDPATTTPEQKEERRSSSLVLGFNPNSLFTPKEGITVDPQEEGFKSIIDPVKLARLRRINEKLQDINRELLIIKNPELKIVFAEQDKILRDYILAQAEVENFDEEGVAEIPKRKPWWKVW